MAQNPKYDNDVVNLGYLNKRLGQTEESINKNNNSISQLPKNYSIPPNPPYYKDSLLCYKNKVYKCNTTKLNGVFSWNDWTIAATDDTTLSDFINNTYELEKLEIQEQIDGKVQTYYQEMDPSNEWTTDLEKSKHIGDYWYNTTNNTQWRYNRNTNTTPITYGWGQVNVPNSVFDLIDKKKSIYTIKPTSYKKDDLWIIEDTLSDEDLPTGTEDNPIAKGDWVFSVADSDTYNKEHWIKRDEDISLSYLEQHYYTIGDIDSSFEELERNTDSKITKAKEEISLNVSQTYTTKEEHTKAINDFDKQIGTINDTITTHETNISNLNVGVGKISASVESIESKTEELSVDIDGVKENIIPTSTVSGPNIHIEDASDKKMVNFEIEGKSTQKTRSGKNLLKVNDVSGTYTNGVKVVVNDDNSITLNGTATSNYTLNIITNWSTSLEAGVSYTLSGCPKGGNTTTYYLEIYTGSKYYADRGSGNTFTLDEASTIRCYLAIRSGYTYDNLTFYPMLRETNTTDDYEPYGVSPSPDYPSEIESVGTYNESTGKYGIEVKNTGKNLFDKDNVKRIYAYIQDNTTWRYYNDSYSIRIPVKPNTNYVISADNSNETIFRVGVTDSSDIPVSGTNVALYSTTRYSNTNTPIYITTGANAKYIVIQVAEDSANDTFNTLQLEKGTTATSYEPYQENTSLFVLDQPLRSLPNGVKDIAYIKNNILYVDRKVGAVVLDCSEGWNKIQEATTSTDYYYAYTTAYDKVIGSKYTGISNNFIVKQGTYITASSTVDSDMLGVGGTVSGKIRMFIKKSRLTEMTTTELKTWLSTHNTQVDYELAEPYTEKIGEVEIPSTFKGVNNIITTDELEPVMNIEYVRDTILSDYVEGQVGNAVAIQERKNAEFQITNEEIKSSVSNISTDLDGTKSSLNSVEEKITSQEKTINIISKNIDGSTGDIREVTTTTGFTFNAEGLTIDDGAGYKAQHTAQGTFYKDGDSITGQYTKDGSKQKDLELFGTYSYGKNDINDTPMFVAQLYTDEKGEECFGHFYNGGDY